MIASGRAVLEAAEIRGVGEGRTKRSFISDAYEHE